MDHTAATKDFSSSILTNETGTFEVNFEKAFANISFALGCLIIVINTVIFICLIRHRKLVGGTGFWQQLLFLCFTDIFSGIAISVFQIGSFFLHVHRSIYFSLCVFGVILFPLSITLSAGNCFLISVQRYIYLMKIGQSLTIWHKNKTCFMIACNLLISLATVALSVLVITVHFGFHPEEFCNKINLTGQNDYKSKYALGTIMLLVLFLLSTNITALLSVTKIASANMVRPLRTSSSALNSAQSNTNFQSQIKGNRNATKTFILIVLVLNLTTLPSLLFLLISIFGKVTTSAETTECISRIMSMNSIFNPFVYSLRMGNFRHAVWNDFKSVLTRLRGIFGTT